MGFHDSRRLTGANLISDGPGAVIDVSEAAHGLPGRIEAWRERATSILTRLEWPIDLHVRRHEGGASLVIGGPIDVLYAACEINEWAYDNSTADLDAAAERFRDLIEAERNSSWLEMQAAANQRGLPFLWDDDHISVGYGASSITWPADAVPHSRDIDWDRVATIPLVMVTGTNGKSTTVRMLASIVTASGRTPGSSSTDGLSIGGAWVEHGDYSGPGGARTVLRDARTQVAILETARGGLLRRGLGAPRADAVAILNVAEDHMGEYGVASMADLVEAKLVVTKAATDEQPIVLSADDPLIVAEAQRRSLTNITWFSLHADQPLVSAHHESGGTSCVLQGDQLVYRHQGSDTTIATVDAVPTTFGGHAKFNVANALAAIGLAAAIDIPVAAIAAGLLAFRPDPDSNPGRGNLFELDTVTAIVDYAHNPHGLQALFEMAEGLPAKRRLITIGSAGDRTDEIMREMVRVTWAARPDRIVLKEMTEYLRGREPGAVLDLFADELAKLDVPAARIERTDSELDATRSALRWAQRGDLLLFSVQSQRDEIIDLLTGLQKRGWSPGEAIED